MFEYPETRSLSPEELATKLDSGNTKLIREALGIHSRDADYHTDSAQNEYWGKVSKLEKKSVGADIQIVPGSGRNGADDFYIVGADYQSTKESMEQHALLLNKRLDQQPPTADLVVTDLNDMMPFLSTRKQLVETFNQINKNSDYVGILKNGQINVRPVKARPINARPNQ